ncbi:MAG: glycosyltransferase family 87 protein [Anaerolineales bacterium]|jgi:hypothetical protein
MNHWISSRLSKRTALEIIILIIGLVIFLIIPFLFPINITAGDFRPYWSSTYLLAHGQDFSDPTKMYAIEQTLTGWTESYVMYAWFAPTGDVILLPFTLFSFPLATYYWLLTNLLIVFASVLLIWSHTKKRLWIPLVASFGFSMTLVSFINGQVNTVVVLGLALFLYFKELRRDEMAGASLVLTTVKPHLVILALPLLLLDSLRRRQWRVLAGFAGALFLCMLILFVFDPAWPVRFWELVASGMSTFRETPTLSGLLLVVGEYRLGKWIWVFALFLATVIWWQRGKEWDRRTLIDVSILIGITASPIGWSYDQVMLLFPLLRVLEWMANGALAQRDTIALALVMVIVNAITIYERILGPGDVWYFWVPLVAIAIYLFAWQRRRVNRLRFPTRLA